MKTAYTALLILFTAVQLSAQIAIGKSTITNTSVSLEFGTNGNRGLILPWVNNTSSSSANYPAGSFILDVVDKKVKLRKNTGWEDLTVNTNNTGAIPNQIQTGTTYTEKTEAKVQIGGTTGDTTNGILVLADTNKAMIPPLVNNPELAIASPAPGMMVYDPTRKLLAVYNGTVWSYWKADY